jgi:hypothetical protein
VSDNWTLKEVLASDSKGRWLFRKNLSPAIPPADPSYGYVAYLTFSYVPRDESGLPCARDDAELTRIEEDMLVSLEADGLSVQVAAVLKDGVKDLLYYTRDPEHFLEVAALARDSYPNYRVQCEIAKDAAWSHYIEFP